MAAGSVMFDTYRGLKLQRGRGRGGLGQVKEALKQVAVGRGRERGRKPQQQPQEDVAPAVPAVRGGRRGRGRGGGTSAAGQERAEQQPDMQVFTTSQVSVLC